MVVGGRGVDTLLGGKGNDVLKGGARGDHLRGDEGSDLLLGGIGDDHFFDGGPGEDVIRLGAGDDTAIFQDTDGERAVIRCGPDEDGVGQRGDPDAADVLHGCESIFDISH